MKKRRVLIMEKIKESAISVLPILLIVTLLCLTVVPVSTDLLLSFLLGSLMIIIGMGLFSLGAERFMTPVGTGIGTSLAKSKKLWIILPVSFFLGLAITVSEPDLQVLAQTVPHIDTFVLILTVGVGVGFFLSVCMFRILSGIKLRWLLLLFYGIVFALACFSSPDYIAVAFDSGGVTTGPMTVPFIMALGVGLASVRSDKNAASDSFGLVALSSVGPILAVLILGCFYKPSMGDYSGTEIVNVSTTQDVALEFVKEFPHYLEEVLISLLPIIAVFLIFQLLTHRYHRKEIKKVLIGFLYTYLGLVLFLCGVNIGFAPVGAFIGKALAGLSYNWILIPIGMIIGYYIVKAEPAIQVLNHQVESVTDGAISVRAMNRSMSIGVAVSIGLAMLRIILGIPIQFIIIPGYVLALIMSLFVPKIFVGIAFDSGGVASGPMTSTFLLPLSIGVCEALGGNIMTDAFGVVALVALTPLIAIQIMGIVYKIKTSKHQKHIGYVSGIPADGDDILDLEEVTFNG